MLWAFGGFLLLVVGLVVAMVVSFQRAKAGSSQAQIQAPQVRTASERRFSDVKSRLAHATTAQEFMGFGALIGDVVRLDDRRFRAYIHVDPTPFYLLSAAEQESMERGFRQVLDTLRFGVQICVSSVPLDVSEHLVSLEEGLRGRPHDLQEYGRALETALATWVQQCRPITKRYVMVLSYDYEPNPRKPVRQEIIQQQALQELDTRVQMVISALSNAKVTAHRMGEAEIMAYLYQFFNRHDANSLVAKNLQQDNLFALYVTADEMPDASIVTDIYGSGLSTVAMTEGGQANA